MFKFLVIAYVVLGIFLYIKDEQKKKKRRKTSYTPKPNAQRNISSEVKMKEEVKTEEIPKGKVRKKKVSFSNTIFHLGKYAECLEDELENIKIKEIPDDLDFSLLKLDRIYFVVDYDEEYKCKCIKAYQSGEFLGFVEKDSEEGKTIYNHDAVDHNIEAYLVSIDEEKRELMFSAGMYSMFIEKYAMLEYRDTVQVSKVYDTAFDDDDLSRKDMLWLMNTGDMVSLKKYGKNTNYIVTGNNVEIGEIPINEMGMLLYYIEDEKNYFYIPKIKSKTSDSAEIEISVYRKKK